MTEVEKKRKFIINIAYYALLIAIGFLAFRYAMGVCFPIIFAFIVATILQRPKNYLVKKTFLKKGTASTLCVILLLVVAGIVASILGVRAINEIKGFIDYIVLQLQNIDSVVDNIENSIIGMLSSLPDFIGNSISESVTAFFVEVREILAGNQSNFTQEIGSTLSGSFSLSWITGPLSGVITTAKQVPSVLIAVVITIVTCCFMTADYQMIMDFIKYQFPKEKRKDLSRAKSLLKSSLGKMGKAYLSIMAITFLEVFLGLSALKIMGIFNSNYIVIIAFVTCIVDIIPILGTGTILLPWLVISFIMGNYGMGIGLLIMYIVISVIRQIIEPKFVAGQLGLPPFLTIIALYLGLKIFGVLGMIIMPVLIVMLKLLNDEGIIHLWKSPSKQKAQEKTEQEKKKENNPPKEKATD